LLPCEYSRINILQWILTKLGTFLVLRRVWNPIDFQGHKSKVKVTGSKFYLVNTRINILQWILVKHGTYLVLKRIWNPIDFQAHRSRSLGQIFRRGDMPRFALPLLHFILLLLLLSPFLLLYFQRLHT
jgi:hypothetical protein